MSDASDSLPLILEALLMAAGAPLSLQRMEELFGEHRPSRQDLLKALEQLQQHYASRSLQLVEVASGWRFQVGSSYANWAQRLWEEKPARYSRALLETLSLIAYRQPITRGEIEEVRGVAVSSQIVRTLLERNWIRVVGHREVPGRPALYATTRDFLDYFNLKTLAELPTLAEVRDLDSINRELDLADQVPRIQVAGSGAEQPAEPREEESGADDISIH